ncbi:MAG TPA: DUF2157 domain-containing protein [Acidimicrobiia bacterium]|nr:DUF2157 domain-containing protein [Acidimicrobiia bacterium]
MTTTMTPEPNAPSSGRRAGATWVAATGVFLLLAAAAVFVATRWNDIPQAAKLAVLVGITGACVLAGDRLRATLPSTGNALYHLGAFLIPIDIAALGVRAHLEWPELLLFDSVVTTAALTLLAWRSESVVLAAGASASVIAIAAGVGAVTGVPAPLVLVALAAVATWFAVTERHAFVWAIVAGVAPIVTLALQDIVTGRGVAQQLGVLAVHPWYASAATGALAAFVIVRGARRRGEPALALFALAALAAHGIAAWDATTVPEVVQILMVPSIFLAVELTALAARRDAFWAQPAARLGQVVELPAALMTLYATGIGLLAVVTFEIQSDARVAVAAGLAALAWLVAGVRRDPRDRSLVASIVEGPQWSSATAGSVAMVSTAVVAATMHPVAVAITALGLALVVLAGTQRLRSLIAFLACGYATVAGTGDHRFTLVLGAIAASVAAVGIVRSCVTEDVVLGLVTGLATGGLGELVGAEHAPRLFAALLWVSTCWLLAYACDTREQGSGDVARLAAVMSLLVSVPWSGVDALVPTVFLLLALVGDGVTRNRQELLVAAVAPLLAIEFVLADLAGLDIASTGLALTLAASVWLGVAALAREPWRRPLLVAGGASVVAGLIAASASPDTFGPALFVAGGIAVAYGLLLDVVPVVHIGALAATLGAWTTFAAHDLQYAELYAAPVALHLLGTGFAARRKTEHRPNSWVAYAPGLALLTAAAFVERLGGGSANHSLIAGAIAVIAVILGGTYRLAAPLVVGTATLVLVVGREAFASTAGIPTWAWLAAGGVTLIGAAVSMERHDVGPVEAGRRVVDVFAAHFE